METGELFEHGPRFGLGPVSLPDDLPCYAAFRVDYDDRGDHSDLIGVDHFLLCNQENGQGNLELFSNLPSPFIPLSVNDDRKD